MREGSLSRNIYCRIDSLAVSSCHECLFALDMNLSLLLKKLFCLIGDGASGVCLEGNFKLTNHPYS